MEKKKVVRSLIVVLSMLTVLAACGGGKSSPKNTGQGSNTAPVAKAGPGQTVAVASLVVLDGNGSSDADGDTLAYNWSVSSAPQGSAAALSGVTTVNPTFTPDLAGQYELRLAVNDGTEDSLADTVTITAVTPTFLLPDTGQTKCYDTGGAEIACAGTGQDGEFTVNSMSFTDAGSGTVTDNVTGLLWQKDDDNITKTWAGANAYCDSLTLGENADWRLPNIKELLSMAHYGGPAPAVDPNAFPAAKEAVYWGSTVYAGGPASAWSVMFDDGQSDPTDKAYDGNTYARCVSSAAQAPSTGPSFADNQNGTVTDKATGLMWQKGEEGGSRNWADALAYCNGVTIAGYTDWQLPNVRELGSLLDETKDNPAMDVSFFPGNLAEAYWSSTTYASGPSDHTQAWGVDAMGGLVTIYDKAAERGVRCVRAGGKPDTTPPPPAAGSVRVRVVNWQDEARLSGVTVVLGDNAGALVSTGVTDANGEITFNDPPADATITAAVSRTAPWNPSATLYSLHTYYDVNVQAITVELDKGSAEAGTANVTVTNTLGAQYWIISPGYAVVDGNPATVSVTDSDIQTDGKVSFIAMGYDAADNLIGYGTLLDQTFTSGMNVTINLSQTGTSEIAATLNNLPSTAVRAWFALAAVRKGAFGDWSEDGKVLPSAAPATTTLTVPVVPGYGDSFYYNMEIRLDQNGNGNEDAYLGLWNEESAAANFTVDCSTSAFPAIPQNIQFAGAGTARPILSWTGSDASADEIWIDMFYYAADNSSYDYTLEAPTSRTSVVFPELPDSLAAFRPASWTGYELSVENDEINTISGYGNMLTFSDQYYGGTQSNSGLSSKWSGKMYSTSTTLAPALKKTQAFGSSSTGRKNKRFLR